MGLCWYVDVMEAVLMCSVGDCLWLIVLTSWWLCCCVMYWWLCWCVGVLVFWLVGVSVGRCFCVGVRRRVVCHHLVNELGSEPGKFSRFHKRTLSNEPRDLILNSSRSLPVSTNLFNERSFPIFHVATKRLLIHSIVLAAHFARLFVNLEVRWESFTLPVDPHCEDQYLPDPLRSVVGSFKVRHLVFVVNILLEN